ncbi:glutathione S-transferase N-terminal domain-containing protein [Vibrio harveyi]|nr:glutathione S-transferase N-terminal domain-containing protein [Vibrio harveyi]
MMTLHTFDSCPYCTRVKALIGLKNLDVKVTTFPLGELEPSVAAKLEKFTVPILQLTSAAEKQTELMTESLDIFAFLDQLPSSLNVEPYFSRYTLSTVVQDMLDDLKPHTAKLCYPRMPLLRLPELSTESAMALFVHSREEYLGASLAELLSNTEDYLPQLEGALLKMVLEVDMMSVVNTTRDLTIDDIALFSELRNLTMIGELSIPQIMRDYLEIISQRTQVALFAPVYADGTVR